MNIYQACFKGDLPAVKSILETTPEALNMVTEMVVGDKTLKVTPIFFAAISGMWNIVDYLSYSKLADLEVDGGPDLLVWTLHCPREKKRYKVFNTLCAAIPDVIRRKLVESLWTQSVTELHIQRVLIDDALTAKECDMPFPTTTHDYFVFAGQLGDLEYVQKILAEADAEENNTAKEDLVALGAAMRGHTHILKYLYEDRNNALTNSVDHDSSFYSNWTPAFGATWYDRTESLEYLRSVDVHFDDAMPKSAHNIHSGWTPAFAAAYRGNLNSLKFLKGCDDIDLSAALDAKETNVEDEYGGWAPIHVATYKNHYHVVEYLLQSGVDPRSVIEDPYNDDSELFKPGYAPVHLAAEQSDLKLIQLLERYGADLSALVSDGGDSVTTVAFLATNFISKPENEHEKFLPLFQYLAFDPIDVTILFLRERWSYKTPLQLAMYLLRSDDVAQLLKTGLKEANIDYAVKTTLLSRYRSTEVLDTGPIDQKVIKILQMLIDHDVLDRMEALERLVNHPRLYRALLNPAEAKIARLLTEADLIKKLAAQKITLTEGYSLLIKQGNNGSMVAASEFSYYLTEKIRIILSKDTKKIVHAPLLKQLRDLISTTVTPGYSTPISKRKMSTIVKMVSDLENASSEILSFSLPNLGETTVHAVHNAVSLPEDGLEVQIQSQLKRAEPDTPQTAVPKRLKKDK